MIFRQHHFGPWAALAVLLGVLVDVSSGERSIQLIPQYPVIGGSVTLSVTGITGKIRSFIWYRGLVANKDVLILTYYPGDQSPIIQGPLFHSKMTPFPNGSLKISKLNITDEGNYTVRILADKLNDTTEYLKIYDMVGKPTITSSTSLPKENDAVTLTCESTDAERIVWSRVPSGATLSSDNKTVSLCRINCMDLGDYRCKAENRVSEKFSDPYTLTISSPLVCGTVSPSGNGLDGGKTAGIVIGTVIGIFILEVIVYFVIKKKKGKPSGSVYENVNVSQQHNNEMTLTGFEVNPSQESNYEQLSHKDRSIYSTIEPATGK